MTLNAENREGTKKGVCRKLREKGKIPAVLYGRQVESRDLAVSVKELEDAIRNSKTRELFFDIQLADGSCKAMMKDFQKDPINGNFIHADFYAVELDRKITARVNLSVTGIPKGVDMGGTLKVFERMVTVKCLPDATPENIVVDVRDIGLGKTFYLKNIAVPEGVELIVDGNAPLATVAVPRGAAVAAGGNE
ncbi:50S ribosomal protein L25 [Desulfobotulus sp. H1]|uniref:Large ribosomal subunit protein bL25 n=1 Tax=Desulfobotulus pelophilus TaxID=2823377 RepID=A0ABT3NAQ5_9BACT|nr:50S ribosomal protein L25 [Desulfobotulus pelophilus]MCW7754544.1 50S ribosomal protein L25 [Desulfobotulus pelophilus]